MFPVWDSNGMGYCPLSLSSTGTIALQFQYLVARPPFDADAKRDEFRERLNEISKLNLGSHVLRRRPSFPLALLVEPAQLDRFYSEIEWFLAQMRAGSLSE